MKLRPLLSGLAPDAPARRASRITRPASRRSAGVALIITLIMISVITFMAIAFLALSRRDKGQVGTTTDQLTARNAADAAQERAVAQMLATILANTNVQSFDVLVSTNFINPYGYNAGINDPTNVNYEGAAALNSLTEQQRNLANLHYNPRAPVFVTNRFAANSMEFRFYMDLNRDGAYTPNGWLIVTNENGGFYDAKGAPIPASWPPPPGVLSNFFSGDPEFIGLLRRADRTHSSSNEFIARYAFIVLPTGKTPDVNYVHNYARLMNVPMAANAGDGFRRNQGVSSAEMNLASFFVDLNTNAWPGPNQNSTPLGSLYQYDPDGTKNTGAAFDDALSFLRYRYAGNYRNLQALPLAVPASGLDGIDAYCRSPLMSNVFVQLSQDLDPAAPPNWHGSDNPNHFWRSQDFFDGAKLPASFASRLNAVATNSLSSYDHSTYYRLLAQLGTDSAPETDTEVGRKAPWEAGAGKLNLNYVNVAGFKTTNYVEWNAPQVAAAVGRPGSEVFFINAADRLVRRYSEEWRDLNLRSWTNISTYTNTFGTDQPFGASRIPVFVNGRFVYSPSLHRQLQLAANLWDGLHGISSNSCGPLPTVFRPLFTNDNGNIYINDFKEASRFSDIQNLTMRDLSDTNVAASVQKDDLLFGVPLIIGVRKGLPNFNEFAYETVVTFTRKLELRKRAPGGADMINETNQMFMIGISNVFGAEFWNSYTKIYGCPVQILVSNLCTLSLTNEYAPNYNFIQRPILVASGASAPTSWAGWDSKRTDPPASGTWSTSGTWSFMVPLRSNNIIIPDSTYRQLTTPPFVPVTTEFERPSGFAFPHWGLAITNRVVAIIREPGANGRIIDYVQLNGLNTYRDLSLDIAEEPPGNNAIGGFTHLWATNSPDSTQPLKLSDLPGVIQQIQVSGGRDWGFEPGDNWQNNGVGQPQGATRDQAIANFHAFFENSHTYLYTGDGGIQYRGTNDSLVATVPFTPTKKRSIPMIWQANDPLVHYTSGDLEDLERSGVPIAWTPPSTTTNVVKNLGKLNARYRPWGGNPGGAFGDQPANSTDFSTVVKDPGITRSGDWQFPTNKLPALGWMGRFHRGTPWQTVYLKSSRVSDDRAMPAAWRNWTGNRNVWTNSAGNNPMPDSVLTQPENDRSFLDLFTTALNDNATRGQLPINQTGLAAWSLVFGGMVALTNTVTDDDFINNASPRAFGPQFLAPAGVYDPADTKTWGPVRRIVEGINRVRTNTTLFPSQTFKRLGDVLAAPELTEASPFLNLATDTQKQQGLNDVAYEWLPQQMLSLLRVGEPRFVIYSYGQTLKAAPRATLPSLMITNYQIVAEVATRAVVRVEGSPDPRNTSTNLPPADRYPPHIIVESFNVLPPD